MAQAPGLPEDDEPFAEQKRKTIHYYKVTRKPLTTIAESCNALAAKQQRENQTGLYNSNRMNSSGFETWGQLHATYHKGQKAQKPQSLNRIMKPIMEQHNSTIELHDNSIIGETRSPSMRIRQ
eukprot:3695516-Amphidinium_carterae.2